MKMSEVWRRGRRETNFLRIPKWGTPPWSEATLEEMDKFLDRDLSSLFRNPGTPSALTTVTRQLEPILKPLTSKLNSIHPSVKTLDDWLNLHAYPSRIPKKSLLDMWIEGNLQRFSKDNRKAGS